MENAKIARIFTEVADLLDIKGDNPFRIRSYRNAARTIENLSENLAGMVEDGADLTELPGIGRDLAGKIAEIVRTGRLKTLQDLKKGLPSGLPELLRIEGVGPKKVKLFHDKAGVDSIDDLERAAREGKLQGLFRMGEKTEEKILRAIENYRKGAGRYRLDVGFTYAESITRYLAAGPGFSQLVPAGSLRRRRETIGDIDILAISRAGSKLMDRFVSYDEVEAVLAQGPTKSSIRLGNGLQVDVRVMRKKEFGSALLYFTGSKAHNIALRTRAQEMGLKVSEYGVFQGEKRIAGETEEACYRALGLEWIPPELRENRGEIRAAADGTLPRLVELEEIRGDLQMHSTASDGKNTVLEMGRAAQKLGYQYIAVTDHSQAVKVAGGLNEKELARHLKEIEKADAKCPGIRILKGVEVDILADGALDLKDSILRECEVVIAAIHYNFNLPEKEMTHRITRALKNRYVNIFGHPTGRLILQREPYRFDLDEVIRTAVGEGVALEIDAHPSRLDLNDIQARRAKELGARLVIDTDAHAAEQLDLMRFGVFIARRGWLEKDDVINTYPLKKLLAALNR